MYEELEQCALFANLNIEEIKACLTCSGSRKRQYSAGQQIFEQGQMSEVIYILASGRVSLCRDTLSGNRSLITTFESSGDIFGEVYAFLESTAYDFYAMASESCTIYEIPKRFLSQVCSNSCSYHNKIIYNMLHILAGKNYNLNRKLQIMAGHNLRQKLIMYLLSLYEGNEVVVFTATREELADYLGVSRPSISRELNNMQEDGLIQVAGKRITLLDIERLEGYL